jgi:hypothetical protein
MSLNEEIEKQFEVTDGLISFTDTKKLHEAANTVKSRELNAWEHGNYEMCGTLGHDVVTSVSANPTLFVPEEGTSWWTYRAVPIFV